MTLLAATAGPSPLWYLTRGAGAVTLVLLTLSVVLGILNVRRVRSERWPRFVLDGLHRNISLLVLAILAIHIATAVLDSFAPVGLKDAVLPFASAYRPLWLGLGALAFDMLLAVVVTSLLRRKLGHSAWRRVHWLAYAVWPVALLHGLGTGSDVKSTWMLALAAACLASVWIAVWMRVIGGSPQARGRRAGALAAVLLGPIALALWLPAGPLGPAWARRSGTPAALLGSRPAAARAASRARARPALAVPFAGRVKGTARRGETSDGLAEIDLRMSFDGTSPGVIDVRIDGEPAAGGGVQMSQSAVTMGTNSSPDAYRGQLVGLNGSRLVATVGDSSGRTLRVDLALAIDSMTGTVSGRIRSAAEAGG